MASCLPSSDSLQQISECWELLASTFGDLTCAQSSPPDEAILQGKDIASSLDILCCFDLTRSFIDWLFEEIRQYLRGELVEPLRGKAQTILNSHRRRTGKSETVNSDKLNVDIWRILLHEIGAMVEGLHAEIGQIEKRVCSLGKLLNARLQNSECDKQLKQRLDDLIDSVFLIGGFAQFEPTHC